MSVLFRSDSSDASVQVGEYQEFPTGVPEGAIAQPTLPKAASRRVRLLLLTLGIMCVLQAALNITLRLALTPPTCTGEAEANPGEEAEAEAEVAVEVEKEAEKVQEMGCPRGWLLFASRCYYVSSQRTNWADSRRDCRRRGSDLVIIETRLEQAFLTGFAAAAWVGMTDRRREGTWVWVDGTLVDRRQLQWALGQPDGAYDGEDCGDLRTMNRFLGLNDFNCRAREQWICERAAGPKNQTIEKMKQ
ncbi:CD209 antigen-like protein B [Nelusetta ayraudi]|uniref:CD209 antigen-like protein B n=1 Tax=Nelusetta ayraudi TaxID=303726 RepID=UPI003F71E9C9